MFPPGWSPSGNRAPSHRGQALSASGEYSPDPTPCKDGSALGKDSSVTETVSTTDLYESTFYLMGGCELTGIEAERVDGSITCRLTFRGEKWPVLSIVDTDDLGDSPL